MPTIHLLDSATADQIAAGEVVERPSSVVKELTENSLDAGATRVDVELEAAGRELIRVSDDGSGMDAADLALSVKRHATSKIRDSTDLSRLRSFGFRGEALPSIASVSHFEIQSRAVGSAVGQRLRVDGGAESQLEECSWPQGTRVEARQLFFNTPARLKFLKSDSTELERASRDLLALAVAHPQVAFRLRHGERQLLDLPRTHDSRQRLAQAWGASTLDQCLPLSYEGHGMRLHGWAGRPQLNRSNRSGQWLFVNKRAVEHRSLGFTLAQAYGALVPAGRHPIACIFLELSSEEVDVNVHPAKREVRFRDERALLGAIHNAVKAALGEARLLIEARLETAAYPDFAKAGPWPQTSSPPQGQWTGESSLAGFGDQHLRQAAAAPHQEASGWMPAPEPSREDWPAPLAQLHNSYLLCQDAQGLVLVDQHAAHERVLYEKFLRSLGSGLPKAQRLLLPQRLELAGAEAERLRAWIPGLGELGLDLSDTGDGLFFVQSIPSFLKAVQVAPLLQDLLESVPHEADEDPTGEFRREVAALMACRAAVKAGDPLTLEEMRGVMADLAACEIPWSCPHGRPPLVRLSLEELEKYFQRR